MLFLFMSIRQFTGTILYGFRTFDYVLIAGLIVLFLWFVAYLYRHELRRAWQTLRKRRNAQQPPLFNIKETEMQKTMDSLFFIRALPNEYLIILKKKAPVVRQGGTAFRWFRPILKIPASAEVTSFEIECSTSNYTGVIVKGYVAWRINNEQVDLAIRSLDLYQLQNPLAKTSALLCDMAKDAVRRSIAEIKVDEILTSSERLKDSIQHILQDVAQWGLKIDAIGINHIFIKSENVFNDLQAEDRNRLRLTADLSNQQTKAKIEQEQLQHQRQMFVLKSELKETEIREKIKQEQLVHQAATEEIRLKSDKEKIQLQLQQENELEAVRLKYHKESAEIRMQQENERERFEYQSQRLRNDAELQKTRVEMEMKNLDLLERKRQIEGGLTDRELISTFVEKLQSLPPMFKETKLNVFGSETESMSAILAPIKALIEMGKEWLAKTETTQGVMIKKKDEKN